MTMEQTKTWASETIELFLDDRAKVFVFRWVPNFASLGSPRSEHPSFEEWLDDMRQAAEGLENGDVATRPGYEDEVRTGVDGHRNATREEIVERIVTLKGEVAHRLAMIECLESTL